MSSIQPIKDNNSVERALTLHQQEAIRRIQQIAHREGRSIEEIFNTINTYH
jgi:hypothetical protein